MTLHLLTLVAMMVARPAFHHFFHKTVEHGLHLASHRVALLRGKFAPDAIMIVILMALEAVMEAVNE